MRPGREAPENLNIGDLMRHHSLSFNEAGARSPGKQRTVPFEYTQAATLQ